MAISIVATLLNFLLNRILVAWLKAPGLAIATSISGLLQMVLFIYFLHTMYQFDFHFKQALHFLVKFILQTVVMFSLFGFGYLLLKYLILFSLSSFVKTQDFFLCKFGLWLWVGPLFLLMMLSFFKTRNRFGLNLHFLD
jgi:peptidoglycan biosynthesis protein MviN/MurJ (putative lipid II flippase)